MSWSLRYGPGTVELKQFPFCSRRRFASVRRQRYGASMLHNLRSQGAAIAFSFAFLFAFASLTSEADPYKHNRFDFYMLALS
jgi:hypothetical protein